MNNVFENQSVLWSVLMFWWRNVSTWWALYVQEPIEQSILSSHAGTRNCPVFCGLVQYRRCLTSIWIPIIKMRWSWDLLVFMMGIPILLWWHLYITLSPICIYYRADSRFVLSQWETALLRNDISHWLGASLQSALYYSGTCHPVLGLPFWCPCYWNSFEDHAPVAFIYGAWFVEELQRLDNGCRVTRHILVENK